MKFETWKVDTVGSQKILNVTSRLSYSKNKLRLAEVKSPKKCEIWDFEGGYPNFAGS